VYQRVFPSTSSVTGDEGVLCLFELTSDTADRSGADEPLDQTSFEIDASEIPPAVTASTSSTPSQTTVGLDHIFTVAPDAGSERTFAMIAHRAVVHACRRSLCLRTWVLHRIFDAIAIRTVIGRLEFESDTETIEPNLKAGEQQ